MPQVNDVCSQGTPLLLSALPFHTTALGLGHKTFTCVEIADVRSN